MNWQLTITVSPCDKWPQTGRNIYKQYLLQHKLYVTQNDDQNNVEVMSFDMLNIIHFSGIQVYWISHLTSPKQKRKKKHELKFHYYFASLAGHS